MSIKSLISENSKKVSQKNKEIEVLNKSIKNLKFRLSKKITSLLINGELIDVKLIKDNLGIDITKKIILNVINERQLFSKEITPDFLELLTFFNEKTLNNIEYKLENLFDSLSEKDKFQFAIYSSGVRSIHNCFSFVRKYFNNLGVDFHNSTETNKIRLENYNSKLKCSNLQLICCKDSEENIENISNTILYFYSMGYKSEYLDIFEYTLSEYCSYGIIVNFNEQQKISGFEISKGAYSDNLKFNGTPKEQLISLISYCSQNIYYYGQEKEVDDCYDF